MSWTFERDFLGVRASVRGTDPDLLQRLELDFDGFPDASSTGGVELEVDLRAYRPPSGLRESFRGPYGVCFDQGPVRHILYPGGVWVRFDYEQDRGLVMGEDAELVYERLYLSLMSRVGEQLERRGLHRVHGMAVASPFGNCLFLMRAGVGKSDLAYGLLKREGWKLISEDTPLLDRRGQLYPFPFRLGLRRGSPGEAKVLVRASEFVIEREPGPCRFVFRGAWTTGDQPALGPLSRRRLLGALLRDGVVGVGVPQVAELFLRPGLRDLVDKAGLALARLRAVWPIMGARRHTIYLTPEGDRNAERLEAWLAELSGC